MHPDCAQRGGVHAGGSAKAGFPTLEASHAACRPLSTYAAITASLLGNILHQPYARVPKHGLGPTKNNPAGQNQHVKVWGRIPPARGPKQVLQTMRSNSPGAKTWPGILMHELHNRVCGLGLKWLRDPSANHATERGHTVKEYSIDFI